jgi:alpha-tubulin suppressor-like RCC1 family protein
MRSIARLRCRKSLLSAALLLLLLPSAGDAPALAQNLFAWGWNYNGQLGNGTFTDSATPVVVPGLTGITAVSAGSDFSLVLKSDGTVWDWGANYTGQLGNGKFTGSDHSFATAAPVKRLTGMVAISAGGEHSLALKSDGTVWDWGWNEYAQLGNGTHMDNATPAAVSGLTGVVAISAGQDHSLVLKSDGTVWAWGDNRFGQLGNGTFTTTTPYGIPTPAKVPGLTGIVAISAGGVHNLALKSDGTLWAWGENDFGELGNGTFTTSDPRGIAIPAVVPGLTGVTAIAGGGYHSLVLKSDGTVWAWGDNRFGQLGNGTFTPNAPYGTATPAQVPGLTGIVAIASGNTYHSLALKSDGTLWTWGDNEYGQLGNGTVTDSATPARVPGLTGVVTVAAGFGHSLALAKHAASDFDGDGKPDILWRNRQTGQLVYWLMDGVVRKPGGLGAPTPAQVAPVWKAVGTPDLDGDGKPDLLWHNQQTGQLVYYLMDGVVRKPGGIGILTPSVVNPVWQVVATPDLDGDGKPDILWRNQQTGQLVYWLMDGTVRKPGGLGAPTPAQVSPDWQVVGTPDLDGDGKPDILWHNQQTGQLVYWLMDGVVRKPAGLGITTPSQVSPDWEVVGTPDLDGDGKPDILWRNQQTGQLVYWFMNGVVRKPAGLGVLTPSVVDPVWEIVPGS